MKMHSRDKVVLNPYDVLCVEISTIEDGRSGDIRSYAMTLTFKGIGHTLRLYYDDEKKLELDMCNLNYIANVQETRDRMIAGKEVPNEIIDALNAQFDAEEAELRGNISKSEDGTDRSLL